MLANRRTTANPARKGKEFERRIARFLTEKLGTPVERNLGQSRRAGVDLVSAPGATFKLDGWAIECKTSNNSRVPTWWTQTCINTGPGQKPVLVYKVRRNKPVWLFRVVDVPLALAMGVCEAYDFRDPVMAVPEEDVAEVLRYGTATDVVVQPGG